MHAPGHLSGGHCSQQNVKSDALLVPFTKGEMTTSGAYCDTLPQVPWHDSTLSQPGHFILKYTSKAIEI